MSSSSEDLRAWIEATVKQFVEESPENSLRNEAGEKAWATPIVGFSSGADPLYSFFKEDIGPFFMTPAEWYRAAFGEEVEPRELTVISWILPQTEATKAEHREAASYPTERWARARIYGEEFNERLRAHMVGALHGAGYRAVAPMVSSHWKRETSEKYGYASNWSERHAAYASGLGTFGLCDGLITPVGKAMRAGSVIARLTVEPTKRPYNDHRAYCPFYARGTCGDCIERCPAGALSKDGHDKEKCKAYLDEMREYVPANYGFPGYGCGLCQTGVPCESGIPPEILEPVEKEKKSRFKFW